MWSASRVSRRDSPGGNVYSGAKASVGTVDMGSSYEQGGDEYTCRTDGERSARTIYQVSIRRFPHVVHSDPARSLPSAYMEMVRLLGSLPVASPGSVTCPHTLLEPASRRRTGSPPATQLG